MLSRKSRLEGPALLNNIDKPGGYCTSFKRKGFSFDAAAHSVWGLQRRRNVRKILAELEADKLIEIRRFDPSDIVIAPDFKISFWNGTHETISDLARLFPEEKKI